MEAIREIFVGNIDYSDIRSGGPECAAESTFLYKMASTFCFVKDSNFKSISFLSIYCLWLLDTEL
jgi:hypothetical protein